MKLSQTTTGQVNKVISLANQVAPSKMGQQKKVVHSRKSLGSDRHILSSPTGARTVPKGCYVNEVGH